MDKKLIHIDDLSRQLLGQREEEPQPGAWMSMRELLDKEMPVGTLPTAGWAWKRYLGAALILLLLSLASISLSIYHFPGSSESAKPVVAQNQSGMELPALNSEKAPGIHNKANAENALSEGTTVSTATAGSSEAARPAAIRNAPLAAVPAGMPANNEKTLDPATPEHRNMPAATKVQQPHATPVAPLAHASGASASTFAAGTSTAAMRKGTVNTGAPANTATLPAAAETPALKASNNKALMPNSAAKANQKNEEPAKPGNTSAQHFKPSVFASAAAGTDNTKKLTAPKKQLMLVRDTIQQIQLVQRLIYNKPARVFEMKFDTISISDLITERWVEAGAAYKGIGPMPRAEASGQEVVLKAAQPALRTEDGAGSYVSLSGQQVSSRKLKAHSITLKDRLDRMLFELSQVQTYTGLIAGFGVSPFGSTPSYGFQLGLSQAFQLSPQWTVQAEFKYQRRMGKNLVLRDDYVACTGMSTNQQGGNTVYNWQQENVEHYFKVSALQSLVVPVNLQYNLNRVFLLGGFQFSYSPRINAEEIKRSSQPVSRTYTSAGSYTQLPPGYEEGLPSVRIDDFGSRFSLGYQAGIGYELTPALKLDVRCTQQFWDNAATPGAKKVSKEFYRLPNVQLSVGYRFGKGK